MYRGARVSETCQVLSRSIALNSGAIAPSFVYQILIPNFFFFCSFSFYCSLIFEKVSIQAIIVTIKNLYPICSVLPHHWKQVRPQRHRA